jgi:hypothetical protein
MVHAVRDAIPENAPAWSDACCELIISKWLLDKPVQALADDPPALSS